MSGIAGIYKLKAEKCREKDIHLMMKAISYLGPDSSSIVLKDNYAVGFQQRVITRSDRFDQLPIEDSESGLIIVADCRLDNRNELRIALNLDSISKEQYPDSRLILEAYKKWGKACVDHLLGEYVVVIFNDHSNELICFNDHLRNLPLYYFKTDYLFIFCTEIAGLLAHPEVPRRVNLHKFGIDAVYSLAKKYYKASETYYEGIYRTEPASMMQVNPDSFTIENYWRPVRSGQYHFKTDVEYIEQFRELLFTSVNDRLRAIHPVGFLLSGGLDSSSIVGIASNIIGTGTVSTFSSISPENYRNDYSDEQVYIDAFRSDPNINFNFISDENFGPFDSVEELTRVTGKPFHTSRHYLYSAFVNRAAQLGIRILFDGVGGEYGASSRGDGLFKQLFYSGRWGRLLEMLWKLSKTEQRTFIESVKSNLLAELIPNSVKAFLKGNSSHLPSTHPMTEFYNPSIHALITLEERKEISQLRKGFDSIQSYEKAIAFHLSHFCGNDENNFVGYDKVKMVYPFLDKRLVDFYMDMPGTVCIKNGYRRYLLRGALSDVLPESIRWRTSKTAFSPDYYRRFQLQQKEGRLLFEKYSQHKLVREIIQVERMNGLFSQLSNSPKTVPSINESYVLPNAVYLAAFLNQF